MHAVSRRRGLGTTLTAACMALVPAIAWAQGASDKPLRIIAAGPPGGSLDVVSRLLADGLQKELNRTVIVEGKPGGGGVFAVNELMQAPRDGNTMVVTLDALVSEIPHAMRAAHRHGQGGQARSPSWRAAVS